MNFLQKLFGLFKLFLCFPRKPCNDICCNRRMLKTGSENITGFFILCCSIFPVHPLQGLITSALQGEMKMRADLFHAGKCLSKLFCHNPGLQGAQPDSFNSIYAVHQLNKMKQVISTVYAIGAKVASGQHHLLISGCSKPFNFL